MPPSRRQSARNEPGIRSKSAKVKVIALLREAATGHRNPAGRSHIPAKM
jgi:hypothetical protein